MKVLAEVVKILGKYLLRTGTIVTPDSNVAQVVNWLMWTTTKHTVQQINIDALEMS